MLKMTSLIAIAIATSANAAIITGTYSAVVTQSSGNTRWNIGDQVTGVWSYDTAQADATGRVFLRDGGGSFTLNVGPSSFDLRSGDFGNPSRFTIDLGDHGIPLRFVGGDVNDNLQVGPYRIRESIAASGNGEFVLNAISLNDIEPRYSAVATFGHISFKLDVIPAPDGGSTPLMFGLGLAALFGLRKRLQ